MVLELPTPQTLVDPRPAERHGDITFAACLQEGMSANLYLVWHHYYRAAMVCKMLRAEEYDDNRWRELLRGEGEALRQVAQPNIVRLFELNMDAPLPYILLEYLPGKTIRQVLRSKGRFSIQDALRLTMYLGNILSQVHERGYIHRDIKPSNVMLHAGRVKLFDFGVAWPLCNERPPDKSGTPAYLAPEQCRQQVLTPAVDIWALGIFLFELLTGKTPFPKGEYYQYEAPLEIRYPQLVKPPKSLKEAGRRAPASLQAIISRCLATEPHKRYATVEQLLIELDPLCQIKIWPARPTHDGTPPSLAEFLQTPEVNLQRAFR